MLVDSLKEHIGYFFRDKTVRRIAAIYLIIYCLHRLLQTATSWIYFPLPIDQVELAFDSFEAIFTVVEAGFGFWIADNLLSPKEVERDYAKILGLFMAFASLVTLTALLQSFYTNWSIPVEEDLYLTQYIVIQIAFIYSATKIMRKQIDTRLFIALALTAFMESFITVSYFFTSWGTIMLNFSQNSLQLLGILGIVIYLILGLVALIVAVEPKIGAKNTIATLIKWTGVAILMDGIVTSIAIIVHYVIRYQNFIKIASSFSNSNFYYYYKYINPSLIAVQTILTIVFAVMMVRYARRLPANGFE